MKNSFCFVIEKTNFRNRMSSGYFVIAVAWVLQIPLIPLFTKPVSPFLDNGFAIIIIYRGVYIVGRGVYIVGRGV